MRALYLIVPILGILAIAYRYYSAFLAARIMVLDDARVTPAHAKYDGHNFCPTTRWVLFGHHFAAIAGAGPLVGPVLAAQFGYAPGLIWLVGGVCLAGAVHDSIILWASVRRGGRSLSQITREEIGPVAGVTAMIAILFIIIIALAGLGIAVVNALAESAWGVFTIGLTIPIAIFMGFYMFAFRKGHTTEATIIGIAGLFLAVVLGEPLSHATSGLGPMLVLSKNQVLLALAIYGFAASVLPVWLLLAPRDYLSSFMKIGTVAFLVLGVIIVNPELKMPAFTQYTAGGGPIIPGTLFPFAFITIACGAISGFHSLVASGTTPKMLDKESDIRPIGYGAMLMEGLVGIMAIIAATSMHPGDYFAINTPPAVYERLDQPVVNLPELEMEVGEKVQGRTGGAVSLAVGMTQIFTALPGMRGLMAYWYHFAIMFEALFILTTVDAGTRIGRFLVQEFLGKVYAPFAQPGWVPGSVIATCVIVGSWSFLIYTGEINTIWPMFGIANQLLATVALAVGTTVIINIGKARYAFVTAAPLTFLATNTLYGGYLSVRDIFYPLTMNPNPKISFTGWIQTGSTAIMMICVVVILAAAVSRWFAVLSRRQTPMLQPSES